MAPGAGRMAIPCRPQCGPAGQAGPPPSPFLDGGEQHQQRCHPGVDVPGPASLGAVLPALCRAPRSARDRRPCAPAGRQPAARPVARGLLNPAGTKGQKRARSARSVSARKAQPWEKPAYGTRSALASTRSVSPAVKGQPGVMPDIRRRRMTSEFHVLILPSAWDASPVRCDPDRPNRARSPSALRLREVMRECWPAWLNVPEVTQPLRCSPMPASRMRRSVPGDAQKPPPRNTTSGDIWRILFAGRQITATATAGRRRAQLPARPICVTRASCPHHSQLRLSRPWRRRRFGKDVAAQPLPRFRDDQGDRPDDGRAGCPAASRV